ncbi:MAG: peptidase M23, partial [Butyrivibrio sp.]|nr:peptidase M23 [Butyrivibrio sp.]
MMRRFITGTRKRIIGVFLCFLISAASVVGSSFPSSAAVTEESIKAKENQISAAKKERDTLKSAKTNLEKVKKELEASKADLNSY